MNASKTNNNTIAAKLGTLIILSIAIIVAGVAGENYFIKSRAVASIDQRSLNEVSALDKQNHDATFVFVNPGFADGVKQNKVILLPPIGDSLRIDFDKYVHKGHSGPLYIILPDNYAGPKEKMILKSFPGYKGWYASMIGDKYVMYAAK